MPTIFHVITSLDDGGAEAVLYRTCTNDLSSRHVVVSMMGRGKYGPKLESAGIEVHYLAASRGRLSPGVVFRLWRLVRLIRPDVVQTWMYHANLVGGLVAYVAGVDRIFWSVRHVDLSTHDSKRSTRMVDKICAALSHFVPRRIIAIGRRVEEVHRSRGYASKFTIIHNGCDTRLFCARPARVEGLRRAIGLKRGVPVVGCVARWVPEKDHATLFRALARARESTELQALIVGAGCDPSNDELRRLVVTCGLQDSVFALGPRTDIADIMNLLDVHVLPSNNEAFGNVLIEAMACETPCISTNVGDAAYILGDTGWIVEPNDADMMASTILTALSARGDQDSWRDIQVAARERVLEKFSLDQMISRYRDLWRC